MSNIYITEPPTGGKVCMKTSVGEIDIELWSKEAPMACRNFIQLAIEGYFDNTIFHRVVKDFIVQGGDSTGTGLGGDSIYDNEPFKDEFHSRLKFNKRGLVALANAGKNDNKSQFFFTMAPAPELNNKHTIFGKVTGPTIYNMLKLQEGTVDLNERPEHPKKIISIHVLKNPFDDIIPRELKEEKKIEEVKVKSKSKATKDFKLLSFGEEAEEEENDLNVIINKNFKKKDKSLPELIEDQSNGESFKKSKRKLIVKNESDEEINLNKNSSNNLDDNQNEKMIRNKFYQSKLSEDDLDYQSDDKYSEERKKMEEAKEEIEKLKKEELRKKAIEKFVKKEKEKKDNNPILNEFKKSNEKFLIKNFSKGTDREKTVLQMLEKFKSKLRTESSDSSANWLRHKLKAEEDEKLILAKDANLKNEADWYEVHDPRNIITKQRREIDAGFQKSKKLRKD